MLGERLWISWETHRRSRSLSEALGAELEEICYSESNFLVYYVISVMKTIVLILRRNPSIIFAQNPSLVLALVVTVYGKISRRLVVIDAHNAGLSPAEGRTIVRQYLADWIVANSDLTIVTNEALAKSVLEKRGIAAVLPDPLPKFPVVESKFPVRGDENVLMISSWAKDEPYVEMIAAAHLLGSQICVYFSGDSKGKEQQCDVIAGNIVLTGFMSDDEFIRLLYSVDLVVDLTTRDNCLVCGAYEAVSAGVPMVLSDKDVLRNYFSDGALFCDNSTQDIADKITLALSQKDELSKQVGRLHISMDLSWSKQLQIFETQIKSLCEQKEGRFE